ncbi:hypothetical protein WJX72_006774 [[Myrmecia] bisecta]|uniref:Uncharacterized protein n=1 Tax=[Myrmecia] bisecta TaxID=41462 RepID=A0AAW1PCT1_9CHLO
MPSLEDRLSLRLASPSFTSAVPVGGLRLCFPDKTRAYRTPSLASNPELSMLAFEQLTMQKTLDKRSLARYLNRLEADRAPASQRLELHFKLPFAVMDNVVFLHGAAP